MHATGKSLDVALFRLGYDMFAELAAGESDDDDGDDDDGDEKDEEEEEEWLLDGVPENFIGPLLKDVIMHEVGHILGLRHNFKASSIHSIQEINTEEFPDDAADSWMLCYAASEAVKAMSSEKLKPETVHVGDIVHWYLRDEDGCVVDPTYDQFPHIPWYEAGRGRGFLTKRPSKRARKLIKLAKAGR